MTRIVVVDVGRLTDSNYEFSVGKTQARSPVEMVVEACRRAERSTGREGILKDVEAIGTIPSFTEMRWREKPLYKNFPRSVAREIGATEHVIDFVHAYHGGNGPQLMVNEFAEMISRGKIRGPALVAGCEVLKTFDNAMRKRESREIMIKSWIDRRHKEKPRRTNVRPRRSKRDVANVVNMYAKSSAPVRLFRASQIISL